MRTEPAVDAGERAMLVGWLDWHRETLLLKVKGLDGEQLARRPITGSALSLLGLLRHLAEVERTWFRVVFAGEEHPPLPWGEDPFGEEDPGGFATLAQQEPEESVRLWRNEVNASRIVISRAKSLTDGGPSGLPLRFWLGKALQEYARHNGHADILRELLDGTTGE